MISFLIKEASINGHTMIRVSPGRYECMCCPASISDDETGTGNWQPSKTGNLCPGARVVPTQKGRDMPSVSPR